VWINAARGRDPEARYYVGLLYEEGAEGQTIGRGDNGNKLLSAEARKQEGQVEGVAQDLADARTRLNLSFSFVAWEPYFLTKNRV
jgi:TPR repeat protein